MTGQHTTTTAITVHPDGSITFPQADVAIIQSALLWARLAAPGLAESCEAMATEKILTDEQRATMAKNADYHAERAAQAAALESRISDARVIAMAAARTR